MEEQPFNHIGFQAWVNAGRLMAARCQECGGLYLPPRPLCPHCRSTALTWVECSGRSSLAAYSVVYAGLPAMIARGYDRNHPYVAGVVQLEEGPLVNAQILAADHSTPADLWVGMPLRPAFIDQGGQRSLVFVTG